MYSDIKSFVASAFWPLLIAFAFSSVNPMSSKMHSGCSGVKDRMSSRRGCLVVIDDVPVFGLWDRAWVR